MSIQNQQEWLESCLGQYLLEREQHYFDQEVMDIFWLQRFTNWLLTA